MFFGRRRYKAVPISEGIDDSESRASENEVILEVVDDQRV